MDKATRILKTTLGGFGSKAITGTVAVTPATGRTFVALQVISDSIVSAQSDKDITNADLSTFSVLTEGSIIYGRWDSITLSSGEMMGYYEQPF